MTHQEKRDRRLAKQYAQSKGLLGCGRELCEVYDCKQCNERAAFIWGAEVAMEVEHEGDQERITRLEAEVVCLERSRELLRQVREDPEVLKNEDWQNEATETEAETTDETHST